MTFISSLQGNLTSEQSEQEINFVFPSMQVLFCLLYKKLSLLSHKN